MLDDLHTVCMIDVDISPHVSNNKVGCFFGTVEELVCKEMGVYEKLRKAFLIDPKLELELSQKAVTITCPEIEKLVLFSVYSYRYSS